MNCLSCGRGGGSAGGGLAPPEPPLLLRAQGETRMPPVLFSRRANGTPARGAAYAARVLDFRGE